MLTKHHSGSTCIVIELDWCFASAVFFSLCLFSFRFGCIDLLIPIIILWQLKHVVIGILTLTHFTGLIYKKLYLDVLETSFVLNLGILAAATYPGGLLKHQKARQLSLSWAGVCLSWYIAFATFVEVLVYHTYQQVWPKLQKRIHLLNHRMKHQSDTFDGTDVNNQAQISTAPTMTIVECPNPESLELPASTTFTELQEPLNLINTSDHWNMTHTI